ncbi:ribosome hibernation-promoting factor, HPF/YfiA family [Minwuia thermotolerans]|uniref:Ribosome hibernation promoting factor n=1 Tax=Minwuia thermotolerans TaxID=2056226 RepID=A0A2M9G727_9PROT|nr:ribosome-associated translation inhibitor RaiA [Minwuia thermotolerans]PJK31529.1 ribosomal subunit interface protein [Minwuia thermotolerans]
MHITIQGKHIDLGDALRQRVTERLEAAVGKYFGDAIEGSATFAKDSGDIRVDCQVHVGQDIYLKSRGSAADAHSAFDDAANRIEKQLRRYKRRLRDHHARQHQLGQPARAAQDYVIAAQTEDEEPEADRGEHPAVIAETRAYIPSCTVSDAVMRMDLADSPVMMFRNLGNDRLNVVYRRPDGNIGWIDPSDG